MRTVNNIFDKTFTFEALLKAYRRARRGKQCRDEVLKFTDKLEENILQLQRELFAGTYKTGEYRHFFVHDAKKRHIQAAPFRDRVVHQAIHATLEPIFDKGFIFDSYACRIGKGTKAALVQFEKFIKPESFVLTADISKYFASIDHDILLALLKKKISDKRMLTLCAMIIKSSNFDGEATGKGIPIGNLTSQLFANVYLNELDQHMKHEVKVKKYIRYMDDMVCISDCKKELAKVQKAMCFYVEEVLKLTMHPKKVQIVPVWVGIEYLGYRVFLQYRKLKQGTVRRFVRRVTAVKEEVVSLESVRAWYEYAGKAKTRGLLRALSKKDGLSTLAYLR